MISRTYRLTNAHDTLYIQIKYFYFIFILNVWWKLSQLELVFFSSSIHFFLSWHSFIRLLLCITFSIKFKVLHRHLQRGYFHLHLHRYCHHHHHHHIHRHVLHRMHHQVLIHLYLLHLIQLIILLYHYSFQDNLLQCVMLLNHPVGLIDLFILLRKIERRE